MQLSVILPTYNENENLPILYQRLSKALKGIDYEIIVVDDNSPDGTYDTALELAEKDTRVLAVKRIHEKGLSSAVVRGFATARGKYLAVMDSDLQHDEMALPKFIEEFEKGADIVVGSRKTEGGGIEDWSPFRKFISWGAALLARVILPNMISDPMSGFFAIRREAYQEIESKINPRGFKILLEIIGRLKNKKISEVGFVFKPRMHGESKLSSKVMMQYLIALYDLRFGSFIPIRFIKFGMVGTTGIFVNLGSLYLMKTYADLSDQYALAIAIEVSIISNFFLNNFYTFKQNKLSGLNLIKGLLTFNLICAAGAVVNYAVAMFTKSKFGISIYVADLLGIAAATAWNYIINVQVTWKDRV